LTLIMILLTMTVAVLNMRRFGEGLISRLSVASQGSDLDMTAFEPSPRSSHRRQQPLNNLPRQANRNYQ
jgi:hypothetical protein